MRRRRTTRHTTEDEAAKCSFSPEVLDEFTQKIEKKRGRQDAIRVGGPLAAIY